MEEDLKNFPCVEKDDLNTTGVLLSDEIKYYAQKYDMIKPFNEKNGLKPSGYELHLGEEYALGGIRKKLSPEPGKDELIIPPFEVAVLSTDEIINLPRFIIARWNLRVKKVYEGLLWTGALQVDAGWVGRLYCPVYNLSSKPVVLKLRERIVLMDFVKTTPYTKEKCGDNDYLRPPRRTTLEDYNWGLESGLYTHAAKKLEDIEKRVNALTPLLGIIFTCIAILFAICTIFASSADNLSKITDIPSYIIILVAIWIISIFLSLWKFGINIILEVKDDKGFKWLKKAILIYVIFSSISILFLVGKQLCLF
jgi:deoxycytidine triphosphate deaminase